MAEGVAHIWLGIDASKQALTLGAKRHPNLHLAVASVARLPLVSIMCSIVLSIFVPGEFSRALAPDGVLFRVVPLVRHLFSLKELVFANSRLR